MIIGYGFVFSGATLVAEGVYARVRHPQYTGLFIILFGEGVVHWPTIVSLIAFPVIVIAYTMLARREERDVLAQFGDEYREYQSRVPMFIPRCSGGQSAEA